MVPLFADFLDGGGGVPADLVAIVIAFVMFAVLYWAINLIDRI